MITNAGFALENESASQMGISVQKSYDNGVYHNLFLSTYFKEGLDRNSLSYVSLTLGKRIGRSAYAFGYYTLLPRTFEEKEIRTYQQYTYSFPLGLGQVSFSGYFDQRYYNQVHQLGLRTRLRVQWIRALDDRYSIQLGNQTHFGLNDVVRKDMVQSGFRQTRLIFGLNRRLNNGDGINVNYQARYLNRAFSDNVVLNHLQFMYQKRL